MRLPCLCVVVLTLLLAPTNTLANDHVASIAGGYAHLFASDHPGLHGAVEVALPFLGGDVSGLVDSSVNGGSSGVNATTKATLLFGLRGLWRPQDKRAVLFAHALFGFHRSHIAATVDTGPAGGAGGGIDILLGHHGTTSKVTNSGYILRGQADWVNVTGDNSLRILVAFGYRYK